MSFVIPSTISFLFSHFTLFLKIKSPHIFSLHNAAISLVETQAASIRPCAEGLRRMEPAPTSAFLMALVIENCLYAFTSGYQLLVNDDKANKEQARV
jgi:hypothetical protein